MANPLGGYDLLSGLGKLMKGKEAQAEEKPSKKVSVLAPENLEHFLRTKCKLKFEPHGMRGGNQSEPYLDWSEGSACRKRYDILTKPLPEGKWGVLMLQPRGAGKSMATRSTMFGSIVDDPTDTHMYCSQTIGMAKRRVMWVRIAIEREYPEMRDDNLWSNDKFTVIGCSPTAEDPTVLAGAPGKDVEGAHSRNYWFDDIVTDATNRTYQKRTGVIHWFQDMQKQFTPTTVVRAIGTRHIGHNLYEEILQHYESEFEIHIIGCYDEDTGEKVFPWMDDDYLERQRHHDPRGFTLKFMNQRVASEDVIFEAPMLIYGMPPTIPDPGSPLGWRLHPRLAVYMLTDTAQTDRATKGASETALIVIAKDVDGVHYIMDIDIGMWNGSVVHDKFMAMYARWKPHGLRYATMEDRGPGRDYFHSIPKLAKLDPQFDFVPVIIMLKRSTDEEKDARIGSLHKPFLDGKFMWCTDTIPPQMFRFDARGYPMGIAAQRVLNYARDGDERKDFLDALADTYARVDDGPACPEPVEHIVQKKELTRYDWSLRRAQGHRGSLRSL